MSLDILIVETNQKLILQDRYNNNVHSRKYDVYSNGIHVTEYSFWWQHGSSNIQWELKSIYEIRLV